MKPRACGESPFCWQAKIVLKGILEAFEYERGAKASSAIAVYCALTHIASDCGRETFTTTQSNIAKYSGLSTRSLRVIMTHLEALGIIHVKRNRIGEMNLQAASSYTLQSVDELLQPAEIILGNFFTPPGKNEQQA